MIFFVFFFFNQNDLGVGQARNDCFKIFVPVPALTFVSTRMATRSKSSIALTKPGQGDCLYETVVVGAVLHTEDAQFPVFDSCFGVFFVAFGPAHLPNQASFLQDLA